MKNFFTYVFFLAIFLCGNQVIACPIQADFTSTSVHIRLGDALLFNNTSTSGITYEWIVNGVVESTTTNHTKVFTTLGTTSVVLVATNPSCGTATDTFRVNILVDLLGLTRGGLPVYPLAVSGNVQAQAIDWQTLPPTTSAIPSTTTNGGQTGAAYDQCGNLAFYALHTGSGSANNLFVYAPDGSPLLTNTTPNAPGLNAVKGGHELQVIKVPQTLDEWYIIYKQWRSDAGAIAGNATYDPTNWLFARVRYSVVTNVFTVLQRDIALTDGAGVSHTYTDGAAVSRTLNGNPNQHYLYLCRRTINVNTISLDRFIIDNTSVTFDRNTGDIVNRWWSLGAAGAPIELSPTEDRIAVVTRNQDDNQVDFTIFDANIFDNIAIQPVILGDLILQPDGGANDQSNVLATATEIDILGTSTGTPLQFLRNLERKVNQIEFSPSGQYLYFVGGGYVQSGFTNMTYLGQIDLNTSPLETRLQVQTTPTAPNMTTGRGCSFASCSSQWQGIGAIESSFDGNLYFAKREESRLYVIPQPNLPMPQNLVPSDINLATADELNVDLVNVNARPRILPDQIDGFNYLDTRFSEVRFVSQRLDCLGGCDVPYSVEVIDTNTNNIIQTFVITQCPDTITFCADTTLTYSLREPTSGIIYAVAIDSAAIAYPDFNRDTLFDFSDKTPCPEICDNGIDDDGDGLIDCFDDECCGDASCASHFFNDCPVACQAPPRCNNISTTQLWSSAAVVGSYPCLVAGDMDNDGIPEIVTYRVSNNNIYIIDGATGATKVNIVHSASIADGTGPAIADVDGDGFGELFIIDRNRRLSCYEHDGTLKYTRAAVVGQSGSSFYATVNMTDLNEDGRVEVVIENQVYDALTGNLLADGGVANSKGTHPRRNGQFSSVVVADLLPDNFCLDCKGLEIVAGNQVYSVNLTTGTMQVEVQAANGKNDGYTSVADFDGDGDLDAIVQSVNITNDRREVYCWDIQTATIMRSFIYADYRIGASRVNIADLDGDGQLEISFCGYPQFYALDNDFTVLWQHPTNDGSAVTTSTVFDFCGDGTAEVIYRNSSNLIIYDGTTGNILHQTACGSATHIESPLVVDVNGDGLTEIVTTCSSGGGRVVVYGSATTPWVGSRQVWNQHGYFNVNINEDLTVPRVLQAHHIAGDSLVLNTFLNQYSNPQFPSPDATINVLSANNDVVDSTTIQVQVCNIGNARLSGTTPIVFYSEDPTASSSASLLQGIELLGTNLEVAQCTVLTYRIRAVNGDVYAVVNCDNSVPPVFDFNTDFPMTAIGECDYTNNMSARPIITLLSLTGLNFEAQKVDKTSQLEWQFLNNTTAQDYEIVAIERSSNAMLFENLTTAVSNNRQTYIDENPFSGTNYYRLLVKELATGDHFYTTIRAVQFPDVLPQVQVYPNPFGESIRIELANLDKRQAIKVQLVDILGRVVLQQSFEVAAGKQLLQLDVPSSLPKGNYILQLHFGFQTVYEKMTR